MGFLDKLVPTKMFGTYRGVTPELLSSMGIRALLIDIDNTLAPYEVAEPSEEVIAWIRELRAAGISPAFISNNHRDRVELFNKKLGILAHWDSGKPASRTLKLAMRELGADETCTAVLGDQLLTDCYAGRRLGLPAFIVPPINDKRTLFFRFKRWLEVPFIKKYIKQNGDEAREICRFWVRKDER